MALMTVNYNKTSETVKIRQNHVSFYRMMVSGEICAVLRRG